MKPKKEKQNLYLTTFTVKHQFQEEIKALNSKEAKKTFCSMIGLSFKNFKERIKIKRLV